MNQNHWQLLPEWHPQLGVLLAWPHQKTDWAANLTAAQETYLCLIKAICTVQPLWLLVPDTDTEAKFKDAWRQFNSSNTHNTELPPNLSLVYAPYNDTWLRDTGPLSLGTTDNRLKQLSFRFNGWGNKFAHALDASLATYLWQHKAYRQQHLDAAEFEALSIIAEGGNLETNGTGILLTQSHCLLHQNRNTHLDRRDWEKLVQEKLGLSKIWWLDAGQIEGDDTDGHIDTLARFCAPNHIVYQACTERDYTCADELAKMAEQLHQWQQSPAYAVDGAPLRLTALPWPEPIYDQTGERLPATYANFLIINDHVLMPTYGVPQDAQALEVLSGCFPKRKVIGIPCRALIQQGGSLHCITMQISAPYG